MPPRPPNPIIKRLALLQLALVTLLYITSFFSNFGVGFTMTASAKAWGPGASRTDHPLEASLLRGGLLLILGGTRTDNVYYDGPTSYSTSGFPLYYIIVDQTKGPIIFLPNILRPQTWSGLYIVIPGWTILFASILLAGAVLKPHRPNHAFCPACNYAREGLPRTAPCPECGQKL